MILFTSILFHILLFIKILFTFVMIICKFEVIILFTNIILSHTIIYQNNFISFPILSHTLINNTKYKNYAIIVPPWMIFYFLFFNLDVFNIYGSV